MAGNHDYYVYMMCDNKRRTLYIGITSDLAARVWQHRNPTISSFTARYHCTHLVFYEHFRDVRDAIAREKELKGWRREKKDALVEKLNPTWEELADHEFLSGHHLPASESEEFL